MDNTVMELAKQSLQLQKEQEKALVAALEHAQETRRQLEAVLGGVNEKPKAKRKRRTKAEMAEANADRQQAEPAWAQ